MELLPHESQMRRRLFIATYIVAVVQPAILVLFLLGSLAFTGGQVVRNSDPIYDAVFPFPVVPLPGWVLVAIAVPNLILVVLLCAGAQLLDARMVTGMLGPMLAAVGASGFFLSAGTVENDGGFAIALWINIAAVVPLVISIIRFGPEYTRRMRAGTLPEGYV